MSAPLIDKTIPLLRELASGRQSGLSRAAATAVELRAAVQNLRSEQAAYNRLVTSACEVVYVIAESLREGGQKNTDESFEFKRNLDELTGVLEKILNLAQANAARSLFGAFWCSDINNLKSLEEQLEQRLPAFGIRSFIDLHYKANERVQTKNVNTTVTNSGSSHNSSLLHFGNVNQGNRYKQEMFGNTNARSDMSKMSFSGKNLAPNFGLVGSQAFS